MGVALQRGWRKAVRTLLQLAAGGALTAAVNTLADGLSPNVKVLVLTGWTALVALLQNTAETAGKIPTVLPTPGLVVKGAADVVVATVEPVTDAAGGIVGDVTDTAGEIIGAVTGQTTEPPDDHEP